MLLPTKNPHHGRSAFYAVLLLTVLLGALSAVYVYVQVNDVRRAHILSRVSTIAEAIPRADLRALEGSENDIGVLSYERVKDLLTRMRAANHDVRFVYVIGENEKNELFFYADSESPDSPDYSPPGQVYFEATPGMYAVFDAGQATTEGPDRDRWGIWISGYAPILAEDGTVLAMLGMDLPANEYLTDVLAYSFLPLLITLILVIVLVAAGRARMRELLYIEQKAEFLSIASHEIRTPLTGIRWAVEGILRREQETMQPRTKLTLELVHESCLGLLARVNNLLDLTALESRTALQLKRERIEAYPFIKDITDSLALSAQQRDVTIEIDSSVEASGFLRIDRQMMHHAFFNLLTNAIKYTHEGTRVTISAKKEGNEHLFSIKDEGGGISKENQERIFAGYTRTKDAVRSGQYGTGLGLYLARKAAEMHGGTIHVSSEPGAGATFTLSIVSEDATS